MVHDRIFSAWPTVEKIAVKRRELLQNMTKYRKIKFDIENNHGYFITIFCLLFISACQIFKSVESGKIKVLKRYKWLQMHNACFLASKTLKVANLIINPWKDSFYLSSQSTVNV